MKPAEGLPLFDRARFDGATYDPEFDQRRLTNQIKRVYDCMSDGRWHTLAELAVATGDPESSVSAQLRHLRKPRFGSHVVNKRPRGDRWTGLYEYQIQGRAAP